MLRLAASRVIKLVHFLSLLTATIEEDAVAAGIASGLRQSKWLGERYMRQAAGRGIPTRTHRVGVVAATQKRTRGTR